MPKATITYNIQNNAQSYHHIQYTQQCPKLPSYHHIVRWMLRGSIQSVSIFRRADGDSWSSWTPFSIICRLLLFERASLTKIRSCLKYYSMTYYWPSQNFEGEKYSQNVIKVLSCVIYTWEILLFVQLTNVVKCFTTVMLTECVWTQLECSTVRVCLDIQEMERSVKTVRKRLSTRISIFTSSSSNNFRHWSVFI